MAAKVSANPDTRVITITEAPVGGFQTLDVQDDIYEGLKDDWQSTASLQKLRFPFRTFGDPKTATTQIGPYVFFNNLAGWRFQPFDASYTLTLIGNLVGESSVQGTDVPVFIERSGRSITILSEQSAQALSIGGTAITPTTILEGTRTWEQAMRLILASQAGDVTGADTTTVDIEAADGSKTRITATVDEFGNRNVTVADGT